MNLALETLYARRILRTRVLPSPFCGWAGRMLDARTLLYTGVALLALAAGVESSVRLATPGIVIDGHFEDWDRVRVAVRDPPEPLAALCDFREVRVTSSPDSLFLYFRLQHRLLLKVSGGTVGILVDSDGDPDTGWAERGMQGVDMVLQGHPGDRSAPPRRRTTRPILSRGVR